MRTMIFKRREKLEEAEAERTNFIQNSKQLSEFLSQRYADLSDVFVPSVEIITDISRIKREGFTHLVEFSVLNTMPTLMYVQVKFLSRLPIDYSVFLLEIPAESINKCSTTVLAPQGGQVTAQVSWNMFSYSRRITLQSTNSPILF